MYYINLFANYRGLRDALIEKDRLLAIQEALIGFLMDEVINPQGKHHYDNHPIDQLTSEES
jgi:hypothetical protein